MILRKAENKDFERILELNEESVHFLSPMTIEKLKYLKGQSEMLSVVEVDGKVEAFILTIREDKAYEGINYMWFSDHYDQFLYIDRVVVSVDMHGKGLGKMLYNFVFDYAKEIAIPYVTAEIYISPPNTISLKFHEKFGFKEVGTQPVAEGKKVVSLQVAEV